MSSYGAHYRALSIKYHVTKIQFTKRRLVEMIELYRGGKTLDEVASHFNCGRTTITTRLNELGEPKRLGKPPPKYLLDDNAFCEPLSEAANYWLGFLMADGHVDPRKGKRRFCVALARKDESHLYSLRSFLGSTHPIARYVASAGNGRFYECSSLVVYSMRLTEILAEFGVVSPAKSDMDHEIPGHLADNACFWRGMTDGDGSIGMYYRYSRSGLRRQTWTPAFSLAGGQRHLEQFLTFVGPPPVGIRPNGKSKKCCQVQFGGKRTVEIVRRLYLGAAVSLSRKAELARKVMTWIPQR